MRDSDCVEFLQWALPRLNKRWPGFRKPRRQVRRRIEARIDELGLSSLVAYRKLLESQLPGQSQEWNVLDGLCRVTISRFYRDHSVWQFLASDVLARLGAPLRAWSAGCASGEEVYTLLLVWELVLGGPGQLEALGTDIDEVVLERAENACYPEGTLRELPEGWRERAFDSRSEPEGSGSPRWCLRERFRSPARFERRDVRGMPPQRPFDIVLCRNLAFTYFDDVAQRKVLNRLVGTLRTGGPLVIGRSEELPDGHTLEAWSERESVWRKP